LLLVCAVAGAAGTAASCAKTAIEGKESSTTAKASATGRGKIMFNSGSFKRIVLATSNSQGRELVAGFDDSECSLSAAGPIVPPALT
jgi:hypothetical protein